MVKILRLASLAFMFVGGGASNAATLSGLDIDITSPHGSCIGVTVDDGVECSIFDTVAGTDDFITVDVQHTSVVFQAVNGADDIGFVWSRFPYFFDIVITGLTDFSLLSTSTDLFGNNILFGSADLAETGLGELTLSFNELAIGCDTGTCGTLTANGTIAAVPLPASMPLLLAGLGIVGFLGRRRRTTV